MNMRCSLLIVVLASSLPQSLKKNICLVHILAEEKEREPVPRLQC